MKFTSAQTFFADLKYSLRLLLRAPGFATAVIVILALGIGANAALFTALDRTVIRPLPFADPDRLATLWEDFSAFKVPKNRVSPGTFLDWRKRSQAFAEIAAYAGPTELDLAAGGGPPEEALGPRVTTNLLTMLGVAPMLGRTFAATEDDPGTKAVVLSHRLWVRRFHGDPSLIGQPIVMSGEKYTVLGVMPPGFHYPDARCEYWVPMGFTPQMAARRNSHFLKVVGRLKPGRTITHAQSDMSAVARDLEREFPNTNARIGITVVPLKDEILGDRGQTFSLLLAAAGCVLLIACANVGNLLLARSSARQREAAVRTALGASPGRVLRQILTENVVLSIAGGALGLLFAKWGTAMLQSMIPVGLAGSIDLALDWRVIVFTAAISILTGLLFGLAPALQLSRAGIGEVLKRAGRVTTGQGTRLRDVLVAGEVAIALVLTIGAVLLIQTIARMRAVDAGFQSNGILTAQINAPLPKYEDAAKRQALYRRVLENAAAIPGVKSAGLTSDLPYTSRGNTMGLTIEGREQQRDIGTDALFRMVSPGYLETMGAELREGRFLAPSDRGDSLPVVVINETLARQYWPGESPLGRRIDTGTGDGSRKWMAIVGVVRDIRERGLDLESKGAVYVPYNQTTISFFMPSEIAVLTSRDPLSLAKELQAAVWAVDPEQPVAAIATMDSIVDGELANRTQVLRLLSGFAALALLLAALGIYSVLSYAVSQRSREIGLRMAIGATRADIVRGMLGYAGRVAMAGLAIGVAGAFASTRLLATLLYGVSPLDPVTFAAVTAGLGAVAMLACCVPVVRAASIDPMIALRED
jgi:predicted permease